MLDRLRYSGGDRPPVGAVFMPHKYQSVSRNEADGWRPSLPLTCKVMAVSAGVTTPATFGGSIAEGTKVGLLPAGERGRVLANRQETDSSVEKAITKKLDRSIHIEVYLRYGNAGRLCSPAFPAEKPPAPKKHGADACDD